MVGGIVIATIEDGDRIYIDCRGTGSEKRETCAIYVVRNEDSERILPGDSIWWQGRWAMWTPHHRGKVGGRYDVQIPRASYSGVAPPRFT